MKNKDNRSLYEILYDDYPEIAQLWAEAVNAELEAAEIDWPGANLSEDDKKRIKELDELHQRKWAEYKLAVKLALGGEYK